MNLLKQQIILMQLIDKAKKRTKNRELIQELDELILEISQYETMEMVIKKINKKLAHWEQSSDAKEVVSFLKSKHIYRMLYRHPKFKGQENENDILRTLLKNGYIGIGVSVLIIAVFVTTMLLGAPFWITAITSGLFIGSSIYLTTLAYGVINDLFATHFNLAYFLLGHQPQQKSMLRTNDKIAQGFAWGVAATFGLGVLGAIVVTVIATVIAFFVPMATFILPAVVVGILAVTVGAEIFARFIKNKLQKSEDDLGVGSNEYQRAGLEFMSPTKNDQAAWYGNGYRNGFGFFGVPFIFIAAVVALIVLSGVSMFLPPILFVSPLIAVILPAVVLLSIATFMVVGGIYTYVNRERHVDDRCNLNFEHEEVNYDLYLDEDQRYATRLLEKAKASENNMIKTSALRFFSAGNSTNTDSLDNNEEEHLRHCNTIF